MAGLQELNDRPPVEAALAYIAHGWPVFPVAWVASPRRPVRLSERGLLHPPCQAPSRSRGTSSATRSAQVLAWWRHWPAAGIGLVTGARSGLAVLDVDPRHGGSGSLDALAVRSASPPLSPRRPEAAASTSTSPSEALSAVPNTAGRLPALGEAAGLDIRGEGGYVVAPPSSHRSGDRYLWLAGTTEPAPLPAWLQRPSRPPRSARQSACRPVAPRSATWPPPCAGRPTLSPALPRANAATSSNRSASRSAPSWERGTDLRRRDHRAARRSPRRRPGVHRGIPHHRLGAAGRDGPPVASSRAARQDCT